MQEKVRKRRGNSRFIVFFFLITIVMSALSWFTYSQLCKAEWLKIEKITVQNNENVSTSTIQNLLQGFIGDNLVELSSKDVKSQLLKLKRIEGVRITRIYPNTLKVKITERKGFLYVKSLEGDLFPVDNKGMVMEYAVFPSKEDLPIVHTQIPDRMLTVGRVLNDSFIKRVIKLQNQIQTEKPEFLKSVSEYYLDNKSIVIIDAHYGTRILINGENIKDQLRRYQFVQENSDIDRTSVLDLRFKNQVVVRAEVQ